SEDGNAITTDPLGNAVFAGDTTSTNLPTVHPRHATRQGNSDGFLGRIIPGSVVPAFTSISTDSGASSSDQITNDQTLTLSGTASAGASVTITRSDLGVL